MCLTAVRPLVAGLTSGICYYQASKHRRRFQPASRCIYYFASLFRDFRSMLNRAVLGRIIVISAGRKFAAAYYVPWSHPVIRQSGLEAFLMLQEHARTHVAARQPIPFGHGVDPGFCCLCQAGARGDRIVAGDLRRQVVYHHRPADHTRFDVESLVCQG